jgi:hypothetical protein
MGKQRPAPARDQPRTEDNQERHCLLVLPRKRYLRLLIAAMYNRVVQVIVFFFFSRALRGVLRAREEPHLYFLFWT